MRGGVVGAGRAIGRCLLLMHGKQSKGQCCNINSRRGMMHAPPVLLWTETGAMSLIYTIKRNTHTLHKLISLNF